MTNIDFNKKRFIEIMCMTQEQGLRAKRDILDVFDFENGFSPGTMEVHCRRLFDTILDTDEYGSHISLDEMMSIFSEIDDMLKVEVVFFKFNRSSRQISYDEFTEFMLMIKETDLYMLMNTIRPFPSDTDSISLENDEIEESVTCNDIIQKQDSDLKESKDITNTKKQKNKWYQQFIIKLSNIWKSLCRI